MALVTCYDPQGVAHEKEPVDAKECVAHCGFTMAPAMPVAMPAEPDAPKPRARKSKAGQE
jgi:hypothetical protein